MGVMKAVGEAVREGQSYNYEHMGAAYSFRCIGIAPWGYVEKRDQLLPKDGNVCIPRGTWRNNDVIITPSVRWVEAMHKWLYPLVICGLQ